MTDVTPGISEHWLGTRSGPGDTGTLALSFFDRSSCSHGHHREGNIDSQVIKSNKPVKEKNKN